MDNLAGGVERRAMQRSAALVKARRPTTLVQVIAAGFTIGVSRLFSLVVS
jgi:hypothetical protein